MKRNFHDGVTVVFLGEILLVDARDVEIAQCNQARYTLSHHQKKITRSLEADKKKRIFQPAEVEQLFKEAGVLFPGQIKRDFQQLVDFNQAITAERFSYLSEELADIKNASQSIDERLAALGQQRADSLAFLSNCLAQTSCADAYQLTNEED